MVFIESDVGITITGHANDGFIYGTIRRNIDTNTDTYAFPLGTGTAATNYFLTEVINNSIAGPDYLTASATAESPPSYYSTAFDNHDLNGSGAGVTSFVLDSIAGNCYLVINGSAAISSGNYSIRLYTENMNKDWWTDNEITCIKRTTGSTSNTAWGSAGTLPADGGTGRMTSDNYIT